MMLTKAQMIPYGVATNEALVEAIRARKVHGPYASAHEAFAVLLEEVDELWDEVKRKRDARCPKRMRQELIQVAAVAAKAAAELTAFEEAGCSGS